MKMLIVDIIEFAVILFVLSYGIRMIGDYYKTIKIRQEVFVMKKKVMSYYYSYMLGNDTEK